MASAVTQPGSRPTPSAPLAFEPRVVVDPELVRLLGGDQAARQILDALKRRLRETAPKGGDVALKLRTAPGGVVRKRRVCVEEDV